MANRLGQFGGSLPRPTGVELVSAFKISDFIAAHRFNDGVSRQNAFEVYVSVCVKSVAACPKFKQDLSVEWRVRDR